MIIRVVYKGGIDFENIECVDCYAHNAGGWMLVKEDKSSIFISSADIRSIYEFKDLTIGKNVKSSAA